jgi:polyisoprenoid-binding protein YceI
MNRRFQRPAAGVAALLIGALPWAEAVEYSEVNDTASTISFTYHQMGSRVYGTFASFRGTLAFDTQNPAVSRAGLVIELDSIDAGSSDANEELKKPAWFDTATYPRATFQSTAVKVLGEHRYLISGTLSLRGVTREVAVPVTLKSENAIGIFDGELILRRADFKLGEGEWADGFVSSDITIRFRMVAPEH